METPDVDTSLLRRIRVLMMLRAIEDAGLAPIPLAQLHALAFFANILSPVWNLVPIEKDVRREAAAPFYPNLQADVDALIGRGLATVEDLHYLREANGQVRLAGKFAIAEKGASELIAAMRMFSDEEKLFQYYRDLAFAFSAIPPGLREKAVTQDATYGDMRYGSGAIIDYADYKRENFSAAAANYFDVGVDDRDKTTPSQKLYLYASHLRRRLVGA
jgi:hypothetical protein